VPSFHAASDVATGDEALEIMRDLIKKMVVRNMKAGFEIELSGELANMLTLSGGRNCVVRRPCPDKVTTEALPAHQRKSRLFFIFACPITTFRRSKTTNGFAFQREIPSKLNRDFYPAD
jgi:hypothetical protein